MNLYKISHDIEVMCKITYSIIAGLRQCFVKQSIFGYYSRSWGSWEILADFGYTLDMSLIHHRAKIIHIATYVQFRAGN